MATAGGSAIDVHSKHALWENSAKEWDLKLGLDQGCARAVTLVQLQSGGMWPGCDQPDRGNNRKKREREEKDRVRGWTGMLAGSTEPTVHQ